MPQQPDERTDKERTAGTEAVDDLEYRHAPGTRLHFAARQRRMDTAALGGLALHLPAFAFSIGALLAVGRLLDLAWQVPYWLPAVIWLACGLLVFHRPAEDLYARYVLGLRYPLPHERERLEPVWREVTGRAGVEGGRYRLWVENTPHLNAYAAAGHIVGVTRFALEHLSSAQLAAVLAHELGHHAGGHSWSTLAGRWYTLPARAAFRAGRTVLLSTNDRAVRLGSVAAAALIAGCGAVLLGPAAIVLGAAPLLLLALPYAAAAMSRRAELRADLHAASLGFAPMLTEVLLAMEKGEHPSHSGVGPATSGMSSARPGTAAHLLASHPDYATRVHRLSAFLAPDL
ncbi:MULTISPECIES: M48 family metalloprotease [unclassified Streptomyces]|uniref:M48 family metalloprotease n=1 Tax=unclassified Streptomyces TaxID=2593676 RepID=UPI000369EFC1|nr:MULTISPECIES: M48 family metalloprotease [unclassified Streptomyces]MYQ78129.1 M48 family metalloprotease [Streptomyces sp. SID4923]